MPWRTRSTRTSSRSRGREPAKGHSTILARSPFSHVDTLRWARMIPRTLDEVIGLQFSFSYSTPAPLGDHIAEFEADLRQASPSCSPTGSSRSTSAPNN